MKKFTYSILLLIALLLPGCGTFEVRLETDNPQPPVSTETSEVIVTSTPEPYTLENLPTGTTLEPSLAGLVYSENEGVWVVDSAGQARLLAERRANPVLSPDGTQLLFTSDNEMVLWVQDLASGQTTLLDDRPNLMKRSFSWWPERPGVMIYALVDEFDPWRGTLVSLDLNTGESFVLDNQSPSDYTLSPDGETILLGSAESLRLYQWGGSTEYIQPEQYQLEGWTLNHPSWSPDGTKLSLFGSRYNEAAVKTELIVAVLDLQAKSSSIIYSYAAPLGGEYSFYTTWSPDGQWISATTFGELGGRMPLLWIFSIDGAQKFQYPYAVSPIWSPDGSQLIFWQGPGPDNPESSYLAYSMGHILIGSWEAQLLPTAGGSMPESWVTLP